jgi:hypothetical protein
MDLGRRGSATAIDRVHDLAFATAEVRGKCGHNEGEGKSRFPVARTTRMTQDKNLSSDNILSRTPVCQLASSGTRETFCRFGEVPNDVDV